MGCFHSKINYFCILFSLLLISVGTLVTSGRCIISDIAKVLKTVIFSSTVKFYILHNLSVFSIFRTCLIKFSSVSSFFYKKNVYLIFFVFLVKSIQSIPQSASGITFRAPMPDISYFTLLGFKPERSKNIHQKHSLPHYRIYVTFKKCGMIGISRI